MHLKLVDLAALCARRPRLDPGRLFVAGLCVMALGVVPASSVAAQDPPPQPPRDTSAIEDAPVDTAAALPAREPVPLVRMPVAPRPGGAHGVWHWDRVALLAEPALSLADLLNRIPGVDVLRAGTNLQPEVARVYGGTSDRIEIVWDGFVLDPLAASALDLSTVRLAFLAEVIVERRIDLLRITLRTDEAESADPYSRVEAALGQPTINLFRGLFLAPHLIAGPFGAGIERLQTDGRRGIEPANVFETWVRWGWTQPRYGIQAELRRFTLNREPGSPWPLRDERTDVVLRARVAPAPGFVAEAFAGRSAAEHRETGPPVDTVPPLFERSSVQLGGRAAFANGPALVHVAVRTRDHHALPGLQADAGARYDAGDAASVAGEITHTTWRAGGSLTALHARASVMPLPGIRLFGEAADGSRGAPLHDDSVALAPVTSTRTAVRVGVEAWFRGISGGMAGLSVDADSVPAYGFPFDSIHTAFPGGHAQGIEAWGRVPVPRTPFALNAGYVYWGAGDIFAYLPSRAWRVGAELNYAPLPSGNLDIRGRGDMHYRGAHLAPDGMDPLAVMPAQTTFTGTLYIRIIDVHIFGRYDDFGARALGDFPGLQPQGPRFSYGVKWSFWN